MASFYDAPRGEAYYWLIDYAMERSAVFMLARRGKFRLMEEAERVFSLLEPYLIEERSISEEEILKRSNEEPPSRYNGIEYGAGTYYTYRCCDEAARVLKQATDDLFAWQHSLLPEDLNFYDSIDRTSSIMWLMKEWEDFRLTKKKPREYRPWFRVCL